ncbi:hypothetical protein [Actinoplanes sp. NPDC020271]|uniref:hypothetical protein n=1 Tax=Actinoplanes sp. NPDC020271 TaxID=3363896 RepID=UPI0037B22B59
MSAEDVIEMLLSVLIAGLVAALALTFWPGRRGGPSGPAAGPGPVSAVLLPAEQPATPAPRRANTAEGLLSSRLIDGVLSPGQYHSAMACLAVREEARNPMRLPGEIGPSAD